MPVSLHFALSPMQFPVVVQVHWTPSAFPPYGSVLACAVPAVFYTPDSGIWSWWYPRLPVAWIPRLFCFPQFLPIRCPLWFGPCLFVSGVHRTVRSLPVSPHYALSTILVSILVPIPWPPSGSVLSLAVLEMFCSPASVNWSWWYPLLPVAWIHRLPCYPVGGMTHCAEWPVLFSLGFRHR